MRKIKVIYLNVKESKPARIMEIDDSLDKFYELIDCSCIDIVLRLINGVRCRIVCDDEGALKNNRIPSGYCFGLHAALFGNLIITGDIDCNGNLMSLTDFEITKIIEHIHLIWRNLFQASFAIVEHEL